MHASPSVLFAIAAKRTVWSAVWSDRDRQRAYSLLAIDIRRLRSIVTSMVQVEHRSRHRTIALFDVDGTLSVARKVSTWLSAQTGIIPQLTLQTFVGSRPSYSSLPPRTARGPFDLWLIMNPGQRRTYADFSLCSTSRLVLWAVQTR